MYRLLACLLFIVSVNTFYTCLMERHIFANFPKIPIKKGIDILRNPEQWSRGICLSFGVPRFNITNVSAVVTSNNDKMLQFYANG